MCCWPSGWSDRTRKPLPALSPGKLLGRAMPLLAGQKALVTGANTGIGRAIAVALGKAGADVAVNYLHGDEAAGSVVEEIQQAGVKALAHRADVGSESDVASMFDRIV